MLIAPCVAVAQEQVGTEGQSDRVLDEIVVLGRFIPEPMQNTSEVAAFILSEDLARQGDSNAALALTRVTGLSIAEGRFVYVRGLGERYSSALLNNSPLPSPEPLQRVVPLDLFPSSVLEQIQVQKSYSVEFPGEFGGGVIALGTLGIPDEAFLNIGVGTSYNSASSLQQGVTHYGSDTDPLGFDGGRRDMPFGLRDAAANGIAVLPANFTPAQLQAIGQELTNAPLTLVQNGELPLNGSLEATFGNRFQLFGMDAGFIGVVGYGNDWKRRNGVQQEGAIELGSNGQPTFVRRKDFDVRSTENEVSWDGMLGFGIELDDNNELKWTNLFIRRTTKETYQREGIDELAGDQPRLRERTAWYERQLFSTQVSGEHIFGDLELDWRAAYAETERDAPYQRFIQYEFNPAFGLYETDGSRNPNETEFSTLDDSIGSVGVDGTYIVPLSQARELELSAGFAYSTSSRDAEQRTYRFVPATGALPELVRLMRPDFFLSNFNIGPDRLEIREVTNVNGAYTGTLQVLGAYVKADWEVMPLVRFSAGLRFEDGKQKVGIEPLFRGQAVPTSPEALEEQYVLPAATITWNFAEDQQIRVGVSKTIGRPQFRELAPQQYLDPESDRLFIGNQFLTDTELLNVDARYERYFDRGEFVTLGAFYKDMENPVEAFTIETGGSIQQSFINAPSATLLGFEIEAKKVFTTPFAFLPNQDLFFQANYTWTQSEVQASSSDRVFSPIQPGIGVAATTLIVDGSRLQGQSDNIANLQIGLENPEAGSQATLLATYVSERSVARGRPGGEPDIVQEPGVTLDFVYNQDLEFDGKSFGFSLKVNNILGNEFEEYQELNGSRVDVNRYDLGTTVSLGLSRSF